MDEVVSSESEQNRTSLRIDLSNPEFRQRYELARRKLKEKLKPLYDAVDACHRHTGDDLKQRINY